MLIGYHASETEMFLIYNYLSGGNLEDFIKERSKPALEWKILHKIALDVARAVAYLHEQCSAKVLHRDIKPSNILLDNNHNAYLSDFGLSKLLGTSQSHVTTTGGGWNNRLCCSGIRNDLPWIILSLLTRMDSTLSRQVKAKDVFTKGLWETGPQDDLVEVLHLALKCT
ncbi:hypothetical protein YC2023_079823 [Brassica napus]